MNILIFLIALLLASPAQAIMLVGFGGGSCATQTATPTQETGDGYTDAVYGTVAVGQSFKAAGTSLQRITVKLNYLRPGWGVTARMRIGTTSDLSSSYLAATTKFISNTWVDGTEADFIFSPTVTLVSGDTYYFFIENEDGTTSGDSIYLNRKNSNAYADGTEYIGTNWTGADASVDTYFKTWMCN